MEAPVASETPRPILQLHATRHCNLACAHCYTQSGPEVREALTPGIIVPLLEDAWALGYRVLSISGGEPLIDRHLFEWLPVARSLGFQIDIATNAMLVTPALAERLAPMVDIVAVSIDGPPDAHNELRRSGAAFAGAERGVRALKAAGIVTGVIHTARADSLVHLRWLFGWARDMGLDLLQLHPLEASGRATGMDAALEDSEGSLATRLMLLSGIIGADHASVPVHVDAVPLAMLDAICDRPVEMLIEGADVATLCDTLVVGPDGAVMPLVHGIDPALWMGSLHDARLTTLAGRWMADGGAAALLHHQRMVRDDLRQTLEWPFFGWHAALAARPALATAGARLVC
jgi:MoaA/NifB/PqqE/SkfB family radical SAM enzyme